MLLGDPKLLAPLANLAAAVRESDGERVRSGLELTNVDAPMMALARSLGDLVVADLHGTGAAAEQLAKAALPARDHDVHVIRDPGIGRQTLVRARAR